MIHELTLVGFFLQFRLICLDTLDFVPYKINQTQDMIRELTSVQILKQKFPHLKQMLILLGELIDMQSGSQSEPFDVEMGDRLEDMIRDLGQESFQEAHTPVYEGLQSDSKKPLYTGCKNYFTASSSVRSASREKHVA